MYRYILYYEDGDFDEHSIEPTKFWDIMGSDISKTAILKVLEDNGKGHTFDYLDSCDGEHGSVTSNKKYVLSKDGIKKLKRLSEKDYFLHKI